MSNKLTDKELDQVCGGALNMISVQSLISTRQQAIQMSSRMLRKIDHSTNSVIDNLR